jgi:hypothetical protein
VRRSLVDRDTPASRRWDERENAETRLPAGEAVHLGGIVLAEAFTPSTVASLFDALDGLPVQRPAEKEERRRELAKSRGGRRGGWQNLGNFRPSGAFLGGIGGHDPTLPGSVDSADLSVSYVTPSLAVVVAVFVLKEESGDLSSILRSDYQTVHGPARVSVQGPLGRLRAHVPWSRPRHFRAFGNTSRVEDQKRDACESLIAGVEDTCGRWFYDKFPGRFATVATDEHPAMRMYFTKDTVPNRSRERWLRPLGLDFALPLWRSIENRGWWLSEEKWRLRGERNVLVLSAKREEAAVTGPGMSDEPETSWSLIHEFNDQLIGLGVIHTMDALLSLYGSRLADLRDAARVSRHPRRPVRESLALDRFLVGDGLDAVTIASDLELTTEDLDQFRWGLPEFTEHLDYLQSRPKAKDRKPHEYIPSQREALRGLAARISKDVALTTEVIQASAGLRQTVASTRLQRMTLVLSVLAIIIAVVGLLVAKH